MVLRAKIVWTLGNLLMVVGLYLLAYVGGLYADAAYNRLAARGDNTIVLPPPTTLAVQDVPAAFTVPVLATNDGERAPLGWLPASRPGQQALVSRVVIPSIDVDSKVVEVGWELVEENGQQVAVWQVAEYAVGQHKGSANPGEGENIVLAGHVGGYGLVFKDLYYVNPGELVTLYSNGAQYRYVVSEKIVVDEEGVPAEQRVENARFIQPQDQEVVTLLTCWPPSGPAKFSQRVIVRALPFGTDQQAANSAVSGFSIR
jgi:sortase (surface protein transpeptidase)